MMNKKKRGIVISVVVILLGVGYLVFGKFGENLVYFFTPSEVVVLSPDYHKKKIRVAGMVVAKSIKMTPDTLQMNFELTDGKETIRVDYEGIPPDLFKEGQGAVVEGFWDADRTLHSKMIMAKHSEDYMPIEMKEAGVVLPTKDLLKTLQMQ
jgi:cytochrome c-type biogenesis protein CcmE